MDLNERVLSLYTRDELNERIAANEKILTYARGELRWEVSIETSEFKQILAAMDARDSERSDLNFHSVGY